MTLAIRHEPDARRFAEDVGGKTAYLTYRELDGQLLELDHTYVPREFRGGGVASQLTVRALEYARERGCRVVPSCPFVAVYIERHPEYRELRVGL
ncbi:MAG TPA: GNAT family N-acetyltransferase [Gammaproteobacteria bacterium]|nr:GNAT family N-acetyltransferase [Gammaproteobacteria bacterium]